MHLPELPERDATDATAALYADIRRLAGVPMVALIFRHLATLPGGIEWMWHAVGPAWRSGELQSTAWRIADAAPLERLPFIPRAALAPLGVDAAGESAIRAVLQAYNRANPVNLLTVLCLLRLAPGHEAEGSGAAPPAWSPPPAIGPLVPMVEPTRASPEIAALYDLLATPGEDGGPRVVQSLYRHLAQWPAFLALAATLVRARMDDGGIARGVEVVHAEMDLAAARICRNLSAPPAPHPGIRTVCTRFGAAVIPGMVVAGRLLESALEK